MESETRRPIWISLRQSSLALMVAIWLSPAGRAETSHSIWPGDLVGMSLEAVQETRRTIEVVTTGAKFCFDLQLATLECTQRIPSERRLAAASIGLNLADAKLVRGQPGAVVLAPPDGSYSIEISGDSVLAIRSTKPYSLQVNLAFEPARTVRSSEARLYHAKGGLGIIPQPIGRVKPTIAGKQWKAEVPPDVRIYACVFPPKPFPWKQSYRDRLVHHCSHRHPYPTEEELKSYLPLGNVLTLHSWVWQGKFGVNYEQEYDESWLAAPPRAKDPERFRATVTAAHRLGMRVVVYLSPYYLADGQPGKDDNLDYFLQRQAEVLREFNLDGVYYDGVYLVGAECLEKSYELVKRSRAMLGKNRILYLHMTASPLRCVIPFIDAYADFVVRGEHAGWSEDVSGYHVSNSIGFYWYDDGRVTEELIGQTLRSNSRLHALVGDGTWRGRNLFLSPEELRLYRDCYLEKLRRMEEIGYEAFLQESSAKASPQGPATKRQGL